MMVISSALTLLLLAAAAVGFTPSGPFAQVTAPDVMHLIYPRWDAKTQATGIDDLHATIDQALTWKEHGREHLVALIGTWPGDPSTRGVTAGNGALFCQLLVVDLVDARLAVTARLDKVAECGGATTAHFDLAAYDMDDRTRLLGIRSESMNHGFGSTVLTLVQLSGTQSRSVFVHQMGSSSSAVNAQGEPEEHETSAILKVMKRVNGPNAFHLVTKDNAGAHTEVWTWNGTQYQSTSPEGADGKVAQSGVPVSRAPSPAPKDTFHAAGHEWEAQTGGREMNWEDSKAYCASLSLAGGGWRLPTTEDLQALYGAREKTPDVAHDEHAYWANDDLVLNFRDGLASDVGGAARYGVRCVR